MTHGEIADNTPFAKPDALSFVIGTWRKYPYKTTMLNSLFCYASFQMTSFAKVSNTHFLSGSLNKHFRALRCFAQQTSKITIIRRIAVLQHLNAVRA